MPLKVTAFLFFQGVERERVHAREAIVAVAYSERRLHLRGCFSGHDIAEIAVYFAEGHKGVAVFVGQAGEPFHEMVGKTAAPAAPLRAFEGEFIGLTGKNFAFVGKLFGQVGAGQWCAADGSGSGSGSGSSSGSGSGRGSALFRLGEGAERSAEQEEEEGSHIRFLYFRRLKVANFNHLSIGMTKNMLGIFCRRQNRGLFSPVFAFLKEHSRGYVTEKRRKPAEKEPFLTR